MGNICRSPIAEGLLKSRLAALDPPLPVDVDSAGTHSYHVGAEPDSRARATLERRGIDISKQRARRVVAEDFTRFDLILAMDNDNLTALKEVAAEEHHGRIRLLLDFASGEGRNVPDPYYGGLAGFERVVDLVDEALPGLIAELERLVAAKASTPADAP
jgi:protein-tyrosine phosphatase